MYIIGQHQVKESVNVIFDDTKLPNIQTKDASEKLKFNNLSDQTLMMMILNLRLLLMLIMSIMMMFMVMVVETLISMENPLTPVNNHQGEVGNNSGGDNEGSTSHSQHHNILQGESSRSVPPSRSVWSIDHPFELIIGDPDAGVRTRRLEAIRMPHKMNVFIQGSFLRWNPRRLRKH